MLIDGWLKSSSARLVHLYRHMGVLVSTMTFQWPRCTLGPASCDWQMAQMKSTCKPLHGMNMPKSPEADCNDLNRLFDVWHVKLKVDAVSKQISVLSHRIATQKRGIIKRWTEPVLSVFRNKKQWRLSLPSRAKCLIFWVKLFVIFYKIVIFGL